MVCYMKKKMVERSVIHKWLLSYIFILIIPLILFVGSIMRFLTVYENEIKYSNSLILEQARLKIDQILIEANSLVAEVSMEPIIRKLLSIDDKNQISSYSLYQATTILKRLLLTRYEDFEVLVYFPYHNMVCSNYSYNNSDNYYNIYLSGNGLKKSMWENIINTKFSSPHFFSYDYTKPNGQAGNQIIMVSPIMIEKHNRMYANIVVFLDESELSSYESEFFEREIFVIIDSEDNMLYKSKDLVFGENALNYLLFDLESNSININLEGEKVIATHINSKAVDWKYVIITEEKSFMVQLNRIKSSMYVSVVLCCIIGGIMIWYLLKKNYSPLNNVIQSIEKLTSPSKKAEMNEYQYITQMINQLQSEKKEIDNMMRQQIKSMRSQILINMVENRDNTNDIDLETLKRYNIEFQSDLFLVLTFLVHDGDGPFPDDNERINEKEKNQLICLIFQNIVEELLGEKNIKTFFFHIGRLIGFVVNPLEADNELIFADVEEKLQQIKESIHKYFLIEFSSACSDIHYSWKSIPSAYSEALEVMEYKSMLNLPNVVFYHDMVNLPKGENFYYPADMETHIINNLKIGNREKVCETIQKVIDVNIENNSTPETIRYLMVNIAGTIIKVVNQLEKKIQCQISQLTFQTLLQKNNVSVMFDEVKNNVNAICEVICEKNIEKNKFCGNTLYAETVEYVNKHYANKRLSVGMIAEEMGVHIVHLSRTFMEYNRDGLANYIHSIRLKHAKKLILTGHKLEFVSESVGYGSLRTFMRVFKKYEGITPGQFKETINE